MGTQRPASRSMSYTLTQILSILHIICLAVSAHQSEDASSRDVVAEAADAHSASVKAAALGLRVHKASRQREIERWLESQTSLPSNISFEYALEVADAGRHAMGNRDLMVAMVDGNTAKYVLGQFLSQLSQLSTHPGNSLVIVCLDVDALQTCRILHAWQLCCPDYSLTGSTSKVFDNDYYIDLGWLKTEIIYRALRLGYSIFFTDVDIVYFKDPLKDVMQYVEADIMVADDFPGSPYNPHKHGGGPGANIGTLVIRPGNLTEQFMLQWLTGKADRAWDQTHFTNTLNDFVSRHEDYMAVILDIDVYAFACPQHTCGDIGCKIAHYAPDWEETCPKESRNRWVSFHLACVDWFCTAGKDTVHRNFMYSQIMRALRTIDES